MTIFIFKYFQGLEFAALKFKDPTFTSSVFFTFSVTEAMRMWQGFLWARSTSYYQANHIKALNEAGARIPIIVLQTV